jgi:hypothetical protein
MTHLTEVPPIHRLEGRAVAAFLTLEDQKDLSGIHIPAYPTPPLLRQPSLKLPKKPNDLHMRLGTPLLPVNKGSGRRHRWRHTQESSSAQKISHGQHKRCMMVGLKGRLE